MRIYEITPVYIVNCPPWNEMEEGKLYISKEFGIANHLCACGCRQQTPMGFKPHWDNGWNFMENSDGTVSFTPSIGNFMGENPYHAHYFITNNKIIWV